MTTVAPADLLATIVAATRRAVRFRESACAIGDLARQTVRVPQGAAFVNALRRSAAPRIIAECKRRSPSRGILRERYDAAVHADSFADAGAAAISVLTEPTFFDGSPDDLRAVRAAVSIPVLRKDFIVTDYQILEAAALGADAVLLIVGALDDVSLKRLLALASERGLAALVEVHDSDELARAMEAGASIIGVNSRNLRTLTVNHDVLERLAPEYLRAGGAGILVAESGIRTGDDIRRLSGAGYDAFLVGERLITEPDPGAALRELRTS